MFSVLHLPDTVGAKHQNEIVVLWLSGKNLNFFAFARSRKGCLLIGDKVSGSRSRGCRERQEELLVNGGQQQLPALPKRALAQQRRQEERHRATRRQVLERIDDVTRQSDEGDPHRSGVGSDEASRRCR